MIQTDLILTPRDASDSQYYLPQAAKSAGIDIKEISSHAILHKSVDARGRDIIVNMRVALFLNGEKPEDIAAKYNYSDVSGKPSVVVVGMGPAGLFAAYVLASAGCQPILLERGAPVEQRKADVLRFWQEGLLQPESNVQFGEGGAGTFSDGKLNTAVKDSLEKSS